jgi:hypothetical protein
LVEREVWVLVLGSRFSVLGWCGFLSVGLSVVGSRLVWVFGCGIVGSRFSVIVDFGCGIVGSRFSVGLGVGTGHKRILGRV